MQEMQDLTGVLLDASLERLCKWAEEKLLYIASNPIRV